MSIRFIQLIALVLPAFGSASARAEGAVIAPAGGWTLAALTARALDRSIAVAAAEAELEAARLGAPGAGSWDAPELELEGGVRREREAGESAAGTLAGIRLAQKLERPSTRKARAAAAAAGIASAEAGVARTRAAIAAEVAHRALRLVAARRLEAMLARHAARLAEAAESLAGRASAVPVVLTEIATLDLLGKVARARAERAAGETADAWLELEELVHLHGEEPPELAVQLPGDLPAPDGEALQSAASSGAYSVRDLEAQAASAAADAVLERAARRPAVTIAPFLEQSSALGVETVAGLGLSLPLPFTRAPAARARAAESLARAAELRLRLERELAAHHVEHLVARFESARKRSAMLPLTGLGQIEAAAGSADLRFRTGRVPLAAMLAASDAALEAGEETLAAHRDAADAWIELQFGAGREVTLP